MSGANSTPLGRMNPMNSNVKNVGSSLLNPTYLAMMAAQANGANKNPPMIPPPSNGANGNSLASSQVSMMQMERSQSAKREAELGKFIIIFI